HGGSSWWVNRHDIADDRESFLAPIERQLSQIRHECPGRRPGVVRLERRFLRPDRDVGLRGRDSLHRILRGHREACRKHFLRKIRRLPQVNYFVDNPGHDHVKCAESTYSRRASWRGHQCRESRGGGSWWRSCQMSALTAAGEGEWADGNRKRYRSRTRPAERRLLPCAGC